MVDLLRDVQGTEEIVGAGEVKTGVPLVEVEVENVGQALQTIVKQEPTDAPQLIDSNPSLDKSRDNVEYDPGPTEEWSRAIPDPARIIFLRQTPTKIYYASISSCPTSSSSSTIPTDPATDRAYLVDLFNLDVTAPHGTLADVYETWAAGDPLLFGKTFRARAVPRGVRVLRQDPWECLLSYVDLTLQHGKMKTVPDGGDPRFLGLSRRRRITYRG